MEKLHDLRELYAEKQYGQVVTLWQNPDEVEQFTEWDFNYCMASFYKLGRYQDCLEVYRACHKKYPSCNKLDDKLGWSIYHEKVKGFNFLQGDAKALLRQIDYVFEHSSDTIYSPKWRLARFVVEAVKEGKFNSDKRLALRYIEKVNPQALSAEEKTIEDKDGKKAVASDRESWYSIKSKLLLELKEYSECVACCNEALKSVMRFHSNNDGWFRYRKAKCLKELHATDEAKKCGEEVLSRGLRVGCVYQLMFELEVEKENKKRALAYAGKCSLIDSQHQMRVSFYEELANYLECNGESELSMMLRRLVLLLREEEGWPERSRHAEWHLSEEIAAMSKQMILTRLGPIWHEWCTKDKVFLTGTIDNLLAEGKSGFIISEDGKSYYFNARDLQDRKCIPEIGMRVQFTLVDKLDKSKGIVKKNAVEITVL